MRESRQPKGVLLGKRGSAAAGMIIAVALLVVGCGGSSKGRSSPPASTETGGQTSQAVGSQAELDAFLAQFKPLRTRGNTAVAKMNAAVDKTNTSDPAALTSMATEINACSKVISSESNELAALVPPSSLTGAWQNYVAGIDSEARVLQRMADDARRKDATAINSWTTTEIPELQRAGNKTSSFRLALIAYASQHNLKLPAWAKKIGTGR